ncbi:RNA methyltransferase [uncultured Thiothrix sp.]|uniref:RNA methyltransferase n=1 Tax=uncultured Thiothrix sp. TaxID=223185 RepID=UPI002634ACB7|nr:RNA methyltransferase [uncultured Thiothrix sp.]
MSELLDQLCIVMIQTSHPGNIGSAARAMKTMGIHDLRLVNPTRFNSPEVKALASGADDILANARLCSTLQEALADCHYVIGTSARSERSLRWPQMDARACGTWVAEHLPQQKIALVFGRERTGLTNEELEHCQALVHIPMAFDFFSLNIAAAIQIICYECMMAVRQSQTVQALSSTSDLDEEPATAAAMESFFTHLETTLIEVDYLDPENPRLLMRRLRRLFGRINPTQSEVNILRGMLSAFQGRKFTRRSNS